MIKYVVEARRWFDRVNGNTYHSTRITRCEDGATLSTPFEYGYGDAYRHTALTAMFKAGWLPFGTDESKLYLFERENDYPIHWIVSDGSKRDCVSLGKGER